jgi:hypothetical protein
MGDESVQLTNSATTLADTGLIFTRSLLRLFPLFQVFDLGLPPHRDRA